ncbi:MAG: NifU family protein [Myxococcota bacterium]
MADEARDAFERFLEETLKPLLEADGGTVEIVELDEAHVRLRVEGSAAYGVGAHYVRTVILDGAVAEFLPGLRTEYELVAARPPRTSDPGSPAQAKDS